MYINRLRFIDVKPLHRMIPDDGQSLPDSARRRLLLQGANGSGKTTILETILTLWKFWGEWLEEVPGSPPPREHMSHYLTKAKLAAMEVIGIPSAQPLWIGMGNTRFEWKALQNTYSGAVYSGLIGHGADWTIDPAPKGLLEIRRQSLVGTRVFPNVVYFPPEGRTIRPPLSPRGAIIDTLPYHWTAVYDPTLNLDSVLLTVKVRTPEQFDECLRLVNLALEHRQKRITGFDLRGRLVVEGKTDSGVSFQHPIEELSSGERQMLLLIGFVVAFLRPGGIVLLDEPDLHIHIAMITQLLQTLELVVRERNGQMIVASHSELVWDYFSRTEERIELSP